MWTHVCLRPEWELFFCKTSVILWYLRLWEFHVPSMSSRPYHCQTSWTGDVAQHRFNARNFQEGWRSGLNRMKHIKPGDWSSQPFQTDLLCFAPKFNQSNMDLTAIWNTPPNTFKSARQWLRQKSILFNFFFFFTSPTMKRQLVQGACHPVSAAVLCGWIDGLFCT